MISLPLSLSRVHIFLFLDECGIGLLVDESDSPSFFFFLSSPTHNNNINNKKYIRKGNEKKNKGGWKNRINILGIMTV